MRKEVLFAFGAFALFVALLGGTVWLANAPLMPPSQHMHQVVPDERIPH
jgi:hypothetical protein